MADKRGNMFFNRELSWLEFNQRVLECAKDSSYPVMERLKFLGITSSNLDEFFMVRVGGLHILSDAGIRKKDPSGLTPKQQLSAIKSRVDMMVKEQAAVFSEINGQLTENGVVMKKPDELDEKQLNHCEHIFVKEIFPLLTPVSLPRERPFPLVNNLNSYVLVRLKRKSSNAHMFAMLRIERTFDRIITLPCSRGYEFILVEDIIKMFINRIFNNIKIYEAVMFRATRNADIFLDEDPVSDFLSQMEDFLDKRKRSGCVRLEIEPEASRESISFLVKSLNVKKGSLFKTGGLIDYSSASALASREGFDTLKFDHWTPCRAVQIDDNKPVFESIAKRDIMLYHPYESYNPVIRFISEAADDPDTVAIKQTLYRTSGSSPIVKALKRAARNGKSVTVLLELKARFDEKRNIEWARDIEDAGVQVIYGIKNLKTHSKICLVIRRGKQGIQRYVHFGTGNYNEKTATLYSDISLFTADEQLCSDASSLFNIITGYSRVHTFHKIYAAPINIRPKLIDMINREKAYAKKGKKAFIMAKMNSLVDPALIKALCEASSAGVKIDLNVRGICTLLPGVSGISENITVKSIVGRFLEHSRIFCFNNNGKEDVFISSADWMPRNLDRRIEQMVPIEDSNCKKRCIGILNLHINDDSDSWIIMPDGSHKRLTASSDSGEIKSQQILCKRATQIVKRYEENKPISFEPYRSPRK